MEDGGSGGTTDDTGEGAAYRRHMLASATTVPTSRHVTLPDGGRITLRDVGPGDERRLRLMLEHVTGDSRWLRFFGGVSDIARVAALEARADGIRTIGVLALDTDGRILGHGMCVPAGDDTAEVAFEVVDGEHRRGIGGVLFAELVRRADVAGYRTLVAEVLPENRDMLDMLAASGRPMTQAIHRGVVHVTIPLASPGDAEPRPS